MLFMALALASHLVRAELVEAPPFLSSAGMKKNGPTTSSGGTRAETAIDAERAFAADAQKLGQWAAFRKWATADATMFVSQPVKAQDWLKDRPEPNKAVEWVPAESYVSCDGRVAANTGPWRRPDGSIGYFSTIWVRQPHGGWKWTVDGGDQVAAPRFDWNAKLHVRRGSCKPITRTPPGGLFPWSRSAGDGSSPDTTLLWGWNVDARGGREFRVALWNGVAWENAIWDQIAPPTERATAPKP